jgi:hypothetical protein
MPMTKKGKNFIIPLVIYPFDVMVSVGESDSQLTDQLSKYGIEWGDDFKCSGKGRSVIMENNQSLLRLHSYPETNEDMGVLQHEIFHVVTFIMDRIGMPLTICVSDEAYAYLIGYLTKEIYDRI